MLHNRLYGMRAYLCGAIDRAEDGGINWRDYISNFLSNLNVCILNPCNKPTNKGEEGYIAREKRQQLLNNEQYDELSKKIKILRIIDLRLVDISDFIIFYLDPSIHLCGSYNEVFIANIQKKPILTCVEGGKNNTPHWIFGTIPHQHIFNNWQELKEYLVHVDQDENVEHYKRWTFFKYNEMLPKVPYKG